MFFLDILILNFKPKLYGHEMSFNYIFGTKIAKIPLYLAKSTEYIWIQITFNFKEKT